MCYYACSICEDVPLLNEVGNIISQNCLSCNQYSNFKYLFNKNCFEMCPINTTIKNNNICINSSDKEEDLNNYDKKELNMMFVFIILVSILLTIIIIYGLKIKYCDSKDLNGTINKEILTELNGLQISFD